MKIFARNNENGLSAARRKGFDFSAPCPYHLHLFGKPRDRRIIATVYYSNADSRRRMYISVPRQPKRKAAKR